MQFSAGVLPQPLAIDVVHEGSSLSGPIFIALGALAAAILTAVTANIRHRRQLSHDRDLQVKQLEHHRDLHRQELEHDRDLHREQLQHDRSMRRRENARRILDEVIVNERTLRNTADDFFTAVESSERERSEIDSGVGNLDATQSRVSAIEAKVLDKRAELHSQLADAYADSVKLRIRFGDDDLVEMYGAIADRIRERVDALGSDNSSPRTEDQKARDGELEEQISDAQSAFLAACSAWHTSF